MFHTFDLEPRTSGLVWIFNDHVGSALTGWVHIPIQPLHPWLVPELLRKDFAVVFQETGPEEALLPAAVRNGVFLTVVQLRLLQGILKFKVPEDGKGSGKNGGIIKKDLALGLINHLFPTASKEELDTMFKGMMGSSFKHLQQKHASKHSNDIMRAWEGLPSEDQGTYVDLARVAQDELFLKERRQAKERVERLKGSKKEHETPTTLGQLLPQTRGCRIQRHPALKRFQAFYVTYDDESGSFARTEGGMYTSFFG